MYFGDRRARMARVLGIFSHEYYYGIAMSLIGDSYVRLNRPKVKSIRSQRRLLNLSDGALG